MTWQNRFDRLLKAMSQGKPHKADDTAAMDPIRVHMGPMPEMKREIIKDEPKKG